MLARRLLGLAVISAIALPMTACDDDDHVPLDARRRRFEGIRYVEAQALLERGPKRVAMELDVEGERVLRNFHIDDDHTILADERIIGRLTGPGALVDAGCRGTLALGFPGVNVRVDPTITRFQNDDGGELSCAELALRITRLTEGGRQAWVVAQRRPGRFLQDPTDTTFFAQVLRVEGTARDDARARLEVNLGPANLRTCAGVAVSGLTCVGAVEVLGQTFLVTEERTRVRTEFPLELIVVDLDDQFARSVSPETGEIVLANGTVVRVVDGTLFAEGGREGRLRTLDELATAIREGAFVQLGGNAIVGATSPVSVLANELTARRIDEAAIELDEVVTVQGFVDEVGADATTLRLLDGTQIRFAGTTEIEGDFTTLTEVAQALATEARVRADVLGRTVRTPTGPAIDARLVRFLLAPPADGGVAGPL